MNEFDIEITSRQHRALDAVGVEMLNDMQLRTLGAVRGGGDVVVLAPTGTGKTLAYLLPLLEILREDERGVQAVVVLPTRELARQVADVWKMMATGFQALCLHGGRSVNEEIAAMIDVLSEEEIKAIQKGTLEEWSLDIVEMGHRARQITPPGTDISQLTQEQKDEIFKLVSKATLYGGYRLAHILNTIFAE